MDGKLHVKDIKEFNKLSMPSRRAVVDKDIPNGYEMIERLENRLRASEKRITALQTQLNNITGKVILMENKK